MTTAPLTPAQSWTVFIAVMAIGATVLPALLIGLDLLIDSIIRRRWEIDDEWRDV